jgi:hypothetical protein
MSVIALGIGDVGRNSDAAGRHHRQIGNAPFGAILGDESDAIAILEANPAEILRQQTDLICGFSPALRDPLTIALGPEKGRIALLVGALQKQLDQIVRAIDIIEVRIGYSH